MTQLQITLHTSKSGQKMIRFWSSLSSKFSSNFFLKQNFEITDFFPNRVLFHLHAEKKSKQKILVGVGESSTQKNPQDFSGVQNEDIMKINEKSSKNENFGVFNFDHMSSEPLAASFLELQNAQKLYLKFWDTFFMIFTIFWSREFQVSRNSPNPVVFGEPYLRAPEELEAHITCVWKPRPWFKRRKNPFGKTFSQEKVTAR